MYLLSPPSLPPLPRSRRQASACLWRAGTVVHARARPPCLPLPLPLLPCWFCFCCCSTGRAFCNARMNGDTFGNHHYSRLKYSRLQGAEVCKALSSCVLN